MTTKCAAMRSTLAERNPPIHYTWQLCRESLSTNDMTNTIALHTRTRTDTVREKRAVCIPVSYWRLRGYIGINRSVCTSLGGKAVQVAPHHRFRPNLAYFRRLPGNPGRSPTTAVGRLTNNAPTRDMVRAHSAQRPHASPLKQHPESQFRTVHEVPRYGFSDTSSLTICPRRFYYKSRKLKSYSHTPVMTGCYS